MSKKKSLVLTGQVVLETDVLIYPHLGDKVPETGEISPPKYNLKAKQWRGKAKEGLQDIDLKSGLWNIALPGAFPGKLGNICGQKGRWFRWREFERARERRI